MTRGYTSSSGVSLDSLEGQKLLQQAELNNQSAYKAISPSFHKQEGRAVCGYTSAACALSVLNVFGTKIRQADLMNNAALAKEVYDPKSIWMRGMRLEIVSNIVKFFGCRNGSYHMTGHTPEVLRENLITCVSNGPGKVDRVMIVNFWAPDVGIEPGYGHFSVAAAYHKNTDCLLVLDTYFQSAWYSIEQMTAAMNTIDYDGYRHRGFIVVENQ